MPELIVEDSCRGMRLDAALAQTEPRHSRAVWQELIKKDAVEVNGKGCKPSQRVHSGDRVVYTDPDPEPVDVLAEDLPLEVLLEDPDFVVINKAAGMVTHTAPGHLTGTLVNALVYRYSEVSGVGDVFRPGIVHRLDKDTSGLIIVARTEHARRELSRQFKERETTKVYYALVCGRPKLSSGRIETLLGRSQGNRKKMSVQPSVGRTAITNYKVIEAFEEAAFLRVHIETGRTHQIRVHLAHLGHPIMGDRVYGGRVQRMLGQLLPGGVPRHMLHAGHLKFFHPRTAEPIEVEAPLPPDFQAVLAALRSPL